MPGGAFAQPGASARSSPIGAGLSIVRYRVQFAKTTALRFIGHLDLHRTWERTFRRAGLPLAYTQGYNPHPRLNLGLALPLGCTSQADLLDVWLEAEWQPERLFETLRQAAPPGLTVEAAWSVDPAAPALQREIDSCEYQVGLEQAIDLAQLRSSIQCALDAPALPRRRRGKPYDLRPLIEALTLEDGPPPALRMQLAAREGATGRPEEVLLELNLDPQAHIPHRARLLGPPARLAA